MLDGINLDMKACCDQESRFYTVLNLPCYYTVIRRKSDDDIYQSRTEFRGQLVLASVR